MLQRLHKLHIQIECQSKSGDATGICFPRQNKYGNQKDGSKTYLQFSLNISDEQLNKCLIQAETRAQETMEKLGMSDDLKKGNFWKIPPLPLHINNVDDDSDKDEDDDKDEQKNDSKEIAEYDDDPFVSSTDTISHLVEDNENLYKNQAVDISVKSKVEKMRQAMPFNKIDEELKQLDTGIPVYKRRKSSSNDLLSPFVKVEIAGKELFIRKRTAVWLFQDTERLSADRLFRVRAKQPFTENKIHQQVVYDMKQKQPVIAEYVVVGDLCAFKLHVNNLSIGRVLQFIKYDKNNKELPYKGNYAEINNTNGVLCTWYCTNDNLQINYELCTSSTSYYSMTTYLCTLTTACIANAKNSSTSTFFQSRIVNINETFSVTEECAQYLLNISETKKIITIAQDPTEKQKQKTSKQWVKCGTITLYQNEKNSLMNGKWLSDLHINAAQQLLQLQFKNLGGLQSFISTEKANWERNRRHSNFTRNQQSLGRINHHRLQYTIPGSLL